MQSGIIIASRTVNGRLLMNLILNIFDNPITESDLSELSFDKGMFVVTLIVIAFLVFMIWVLRKANHAVFKRAMKDRKEIHLMFFEKLLSNVILIAGIILIFSLFGGFDSVWKTVLGGTAIISGVLAFAAQDAIKDILAGLMISLYKPFEIGNRIVMEDGTAGIVKDITMRHVVLQGIDSLVYVVPNSKLNVMCIQNFSYHSELRAYQFNFQIAYGSDVELAKSLIKEVIIDSEYTVAGVKAADGSLEYGEVYFMAYEDSSYRMVTTAYYMPSSPTEKMVSDINSRVEKIFEENHIEIPFKYVNVVQK